MEDGQRPTIDNKEKHIMTAEPTIEFVTIEETAPTNEFDPIVAAQIEAGPKAGFTITGTDDKDVDKKLRRYGAAARRADRSPKQVSREKDAKGNVTVVVGLRARIERPRGENAGDEPATETAE